MASLFSSSRDLRRHVGRLVSLGCLLLEEVGEEEKLEDDEDDEELDEDHEP